MKKRIELLDLLRGFALLGILIMNIISFSNVGVGYINPTLGAGVEGHNAIFHGISQLFAHTRFMSIFSILFGAGVVLFADNIVKKGLSPAKYHYRRMFWLLLFGMAHAYLIWSGDILVPYAICGSLVFLMRKWSTKRLIIVGAIIFAIPVLMNTMNYAFTPESIRLDQFQEFYSPSEQELADEIEIYRGSYMDQLPHRIHTSIELQTFIFLIETMWRALSMMMLGMILYRKGVLSGESSASTYRKMMIYGILSGLAISSLGLYQSYANDWSSADVMTMGSVLTYIASLCMALGYIGAVMLWSRSSLASSLQSRLQAVGRMAFTNYIGMSVICTLIYYGHGLGLLAMMDRAQQWLVIVGVWALILIVSPWYQQRYGQGPLEKLWRKLTYL